MSDDEDFGEGKVLGPMLDYTRYYPTTLPMHQPRQDDSAASETSEEVGQATPLPFSILAMSMGSFESSGWRSGYSLRPCEGLAWLNGASCAGC